VFEGFSGKSIEACPSNPGHEAGGKTGERRSSFLCCGIWFVHFDMTPEIYWDIIKTTGVVRMVSSGGEPVPAKGRRGVSSLMISTGQTATGRRTRLM